MIHRSDEFPLYDKELFGFDKDAHDDFDKTCINSLSGIRFLVPMAQIIRASAKQQTRVHGKSTKHAVENRSHDFDCEESPLVNKTCTNSLSLVCFLVPMAYITKTHAIHCKRHFFLPLLAMKVDAFGK